MEPSSVTWALMCNMKGHVPAVDSLIDVQVWDREKIVIIPDHYIFTADERANRNVDILRDFAQEQNLKYFYDITDRSNFRVSRSHSLKRGPPSALNQKYITRNEYHPCTGVVLLGTSQDGLLTKLRILRSAFC